MNDRAGPKSPGDEFADRGIAESAGRRLDWDDVRVFLAVAEAGSLNAATKTLGMTQPTISRRMEELEYRLNARLFHRSPRGVSLTASGETMLELARGMARLGGSIVRSVGDNDHAETGRVRLAAPDGMASFVLMPTLATFQQANPGIDLCIDCGLWPAAPLPGELDLSMDFGAASAPDLVSIPLATLHYAYYAARDYLNIYGTPKTYADIARHRIATHAAFKEQRENWNRQAFVAADVAGRHLITNSSAALVMAVERGAGIAALPTVVASLGRDLVMLDLDPVAHISLWLRHHPVAARQGRVMKVRDWIVRAFDARDKPWFREEFIHPSDFRRTPPARPMSRFMPRIA